MPMFGNRARYSITVSSVASPSAKESDMWQYVHYGEFDSQAFYANRVSILGSRFDLSAADDSERSQLKQAEWLSRQLGTHVTLNIQSKAQFGYVEPEYTFYKYKCTPTCVALEH